MKRILLLTMLLGLFSSLTILADDFDDRPAPPPEDHQFAGLDPMFGIDCPDFQAMGERRGGGRMQGRFDNGRHLEQFRTLKLLELLNLNEEQEDTFLKEFRDLRRDLGDIRDTKDSAVSELSSGLHSGTISDGRVNELIERIYSNQEKLRTREAAFHKEMKKILNPQQLGRMVVFDQRFDRELLHKMEAFKDRAVPGAHGFDSTRSNDGN
jgi:Spy/CpxP family protein refolding chaperone